MRVATTSKGLAMTGDQFRAALAALGLSLPQAATMLGLHRVTVRSFASGRYPVPVTVQQFLRFALAVDSARRAVILAGMLAGTEPARKAPSPRKPAGGSRSGKEPMKHVP
jgi:formylglycine-generating enzyme required for sulfatase activity